MADIELRALTKRFGALAAVDRVDLDVEAGEVMCLLGPSGCGKTTTLRMVAGLEWATEGDIFIAGKRVNDLRPAQRDIAMVFQFYALYPSLTVAQNLAFPLHAERIAETEINRRVSRIADLLDLSHAMDRIPGRLAEGEKQRVAVGRAIIRDPQCFLFDEPLSRLDIAVRQEMRGQIKQLLNGLHKSTVIVTHDQIEALTIADRIAVMRDGIIEQVASPHDIFALPSNVFVAGFIGTPQMNLLDARVLRAEEGSVTVRVLDQEVALPVGAKAAGGLDGKQNGPLTVGVRPRGLTLTSEPGAETISGQIDLVEPMGAETLIHLRIGNDDLRIVADRRASAVVGDTIHVTPVASQIHLFDHEGERISA
jgi:ABC-type sugar transport system ATPase subunit